MRKLLALATVLITLLPFYSCQKDLEREDLDPDQSGTTNQVAKYTETSYVDGELWDRTTLLGEYDSQGRLTAMRDSADAGSGFFYQYLTNKVVFTIKSYDDPDIVVNFLLNANGTMDSSFQVDDTDSVTAKFHYNAQGQMIRQVDYWFDVEDGGNAPYDVVVTTYTYDNHGNLVKAVDTDGWGEEKEYDVSKKHILPVVFHPTLKIGSIEQHLEKASKYFDDNMLFAESTSTYVIDDKNRVIEKRETSNEDGYEIMVITTITYK